MKTPRSLEKRTDWNEGRGRKLCEQWGDGGHRLGGADVACPETVLFWEEGKSGG